MDNRYKVGMVIIYTVVCLAVGRYTVSTKIVDTKSSTQIVNNKETKIDDKNVDKHDDKTTKQVVVQIVNKDGSAQTTTTTITEDKDNIIAKTDDKTVNLDNSSTINTETKTITKGGSKTNISLLGGVNLSNPAGGMLYGLSVNREIIGPITLGVFGLSNGSAGLSLGINF